MLAKGEAAAVAAAAAAHHDDGNMPHAVNVVKHGVCQTSPSIAEAVAGVEHHICGGLYGIRRGEQCSKHQNLGCSMRNELLKRG